jgi:hypothetical protein
LQVDVLDAGTVSDLTLYSTVILGSSVYIGCWHKKVVHFLNKNIESLEKLPVWIFICGPTGPGNPIERLDGWFAPNLSSRSLNVFILAESPALAVNWC